jgi:hypothetical protein
MTIQPTYFSTLPGELIAKIAMQLPDSQLLSLSLVSKAVQTVLKNYETQLWNGIEHPSKKSYLLHQFLFSLDIQTDESHLLFFNFKDFENLHPRISTFINLIAKVNNTANVQATFTVDGELEKSIFSSSHRPERWRAKLTYTENSSIPPSYFIEMRGICLIPQKLSSMLSSNSTSVVNDGLIKVSEDYCPKGMSQTMVLITSSLAKKLFN